MNKIKETEKECCARCRWTEVEARPYGAVEYLCKLLRERISSSAVSKRCCAEFER